MMIRCPPLRAKDHAVVANSKPVVSRHAFKLPDVAMLGFSVAPDECPDPFGRLSAKTA
jgi:hypothetical protein